MSDLMVWCVLCIDDTGDEETHVFSTKEKAIAYMEGYPDRRHVLYDYLVDRPERMHERASAVQ